MSPQTLRFVAFVKTHETRYGSMPSDEEISQAFGWTVKTAYHRCYEAEKAGLIARHRRDYARTGERPRKMTPDTIRAIEQYEYYRHFWSKGQPCVMSVYYNMLAWADEVLLHIPEGAKWLDHHGTRYYRGYEGGRPVLMHFRIKHHLAEHA